MHHMERFGPLRHLVGVWQGTQGHDVSATPDGHSETPFKETLTFEIIESVANAKSQTLAVLRYHQTVLSLDNNAPIHDEVGYWMWDAQQQIVMHALTIPRGLSLLAGGTVKATKDGVSFYVEASQGHADWGIAQSPFMQKQAQVKAFKQSLHVKGDQLAYEETTFLDIYGKAFEHTDRNTLKHVVNH